MSPANIAMLSRVELMYVADRAMPLKFTTEPVTKFEPFTVSVNPAPPAATLDGLMDEIVGEGLNTVNPAEVEAPPPGSGLDTNTTAAPPFAISALKISAVS